MTRLDPYWRVDVLILHQDRTQTYVPFYPGKDALLPLVEDVCGSGRRVMLTITVLGEDWSEPKDPWKALHDEPPKMV